jgi:8-oxo-dGTP diphosphatase
VLLVHFDFKEPGLPHGLWACPGGGIMPGESTQEALQRELREELGLVVVDVGAPVWWKERVFPMTRWDGQHDTYFWVEVDAFDPRPQFTEMELRAEHVDGMRWWTYDEVASAQRVYDAGNADDPAYTVFSPRQLGRLLDDLIQRGRPSEPVHIEAL